MHFLLPSKERDNPSLKGQACRLWRTLVSQEGEVWSRPCNYEARKYGSFSHEFQRSAGPLSSSHFLSLEIMKSTERWANRFVSIFKRYTDLIEPMSIDEAYLDVTENKIQSKSAVKIARLIQHAIWENCISQLQQASLIISFGQDGK